jgi:hypothetical protein
LVFVNRSAFEGIRPICCLKLFVRLRLLRAASFAASSVSCGEFGGVLHLAVFWAGEPAIAMPVC